MASLEFSGLLTENSSVAYFDYEIWFPLVKLSQNMPGKQEPGGFSYQTSDLRESNFPEGYHLPHTVETGTFRVRDKPK
ncbi:unnamed protein product [Blepharisma stoltei]|uniref:Uncharacterized protein n=1 Tax=Blepharisma stoltei TaxID=1481888 RepID=A0AAU9JP74_9CILI|nr:unnamed protein product [Blepharisma stoltei]